MTALKDVRVLELGALIAGPYASALFAQFGADVIKVEPLQGDPLRTWRKVHDGTSLWWRSQSRNKKSMALDLKKAAAQELVRRLIPKIDVVIENFRPGTLEKWGLGWDQLKALNPKLVMVRVSGYGQSGPKRDLPGFAAIGEAMGGLRHLTGFPDRPPVRTGVSLGDTLAGLYGAFGAMVALHHVRAGGEGQLVDVALYESVLAVTESLIPEYGKLGFVRERSGASLPGIAPSNTYLCGDGGYVVIAGNADPIWLRLARAIGRDDLANDPELANNAGRVRHVVRIDGAIGEWTGKRSVAEVVTALEAAEVPAGSIYTAADVHADPHIRARNMIETHVLPDGSNIDIPGAVPQLETTPGETRWLGPALGEHTNEVLRALGVDDDELLRLRAELVIA